MIWICTLCTYKPDLFIYEGVFLQTKPVECQLLFSGAAFIVLRSCGPSMLIVWPLPSWVAAAKLWPILSHCSPLTCSSVSWHHSLSGLHLSIFLNSHHPFSQFFLCLLISPLFRLSIYHSQLCCQLPCFPVSKGWKRCLTVTHNLQLCFISHLMVHCSCPWLSASPAASCKASSLSQMPFFTLAH